MKKLIAVAMFLIVSVISCSSVETAGLLEPETLKLILEYGGLPAVILILGFWYLRSSNKQWARLLEQQQNQFNQMNKELLGVITNNTAVMSALTTKFGMGCALFARRPNEEVGDAKEERQP